MAYTNGSLSGRRRGARGTKLAISSRSLKWYSAGGMLDRRLHNGQNGLSSVIDRPHNQEQFLWRRCDEEPIKTLFLTVIAVVVGCFLVPLFLSNSGNLLGRSGLQIRYDQLVGDLGQHRVRTARWYENQLDGELVDWQPLLC